MQKITYDWFSQHKTECFTKAPSVYYVISEKLEVHIGNEDDCNIEYCKANDIPVYDLGRCGGTIVCCNGTIGYALITNITGGWKNHKFIKEFNKFLINKGLFPVTDHNDILLDGYKVTSAAEWRVGVDLDKIFGVYLISYDVDMDAISHICQKDMTKIPKGLKDFNITKEDLIEWTKAYFSKFER